MRLSWRGSRCWTTSTEAEAPRAGASRRVSAASPPAEEPMAIVSKLGASTRAEDPRRSAPQPRSYRSSRRFGGDVGGLDVVAGVCSRQHAPNEDGLMASWALLGSKPDSSSESGGIGSLVAPSSRVLTTIVGSWRTAGCVEARRRPRRIVPSAGVRAPTSGRGTRPDRLAAKTLGSWIGGCSERRRASLGLKRRWPPTASSSEATSSASHPSRRSQRSRGRRACAPGSCRARSSRRARSAPRVGAPCPLRPVSSQSSRCSASTRLSPLCTPPPGSSQTSPPSFECRQSSMRPSPAHDRGDANLGALPSTRGRPESARAALACCELLDFDQAYRGDRSTTSCAMRMPGSTVNGSRASVFRRTTSTSPR